MDALRVASLIERRLTHGACGAYHRSAAMCAQSAPKSPIRIVTLCASGNLVGFKVRNRFARKEGKIHVEQISIAIALGHGVCRLGHAPQGMQPLGQHTPGKGYSEKHKNISGRASERKRLSDMDVVRKRAHKRAFLRIQDSRGILRLFQPV